MKRYINFCAAAVLCALLPVMTAGCSDIAADTGSQAEIQMEMREDSAETTAATELVTEAAIETTTAATASTEAATQADTTTAPASETIGNTGMTAEQWCAKAQTIYENAASTAFSYFGSTAGCVIDESDVVDEVWRHVTNYSTIEEATAPYFAVFSKTLHENDMAELFRMIDEKLYCCLGDRGADISYISSEVTALTASTDTTLSFTVTSTYQFPDESEATTQEDAFTLVYENDQWLVGEFTLPY